MPLPSLTESILDNVSPMWYSNEFKSVIEDHLLRLRTRSPAVFPITTDEGRNHVGDLYSLFTSRNLLSKYHWIIMRVNNFTCPYKYSGEAFDLIIPNEEFIDAIYDSFRTTYGD